MIALLAKYRAMIPAHDVALVVDDTVLEWLAFAVEKHDASKWGGTAIYQRAMVFYAAHYVEVIPGTGVSDGGAGGAGGSASSATVVTKREDGDVTETYGSTTSSSSSGGAGGSADATALAMTVYGTAYLAIRGSRAAVVPQVMW